MSLSDTHPTTIDRGRSRLGAVIDELRADGRLTDDDAADLSRRADALAADLVSCIETEEGR